MRPSAIGKDYKGYNGFEGDEDDERGYGYPESNVNTSRTSGEMLHEDSQESASAQTSIDERADVQASYEPLRIEAVMCVIFSGLIGILLGYDIGITAGALLPLGDYFALSDHELELFVGILNFVALPGSLLGGPLADYAGRIRGLRVALVMFLCGNLVQTLAWSYAMLMIGRLIAGFAMGLTLVMAPLYCAEISPSRVRGFLTSLIELSYNSGIVLGYVASWALRHWQDKATVWRIMLGLGVLPPLVILAGSACCMYESPRWLAAKGRCDDAEHVLSKVLGPMEAQQATKILRDSASPCPEYLDAKEKISFLECARSPRMKWALFTGSCVAIFSQGQGVEALLYYSNSILQESGVDKEHMLLMTMLVGFAKLGAILASGIVVDKFGRRFLLMLSSSGMGLSMAVMSESSRSHWPNGFQVGAMVSYMISFSLGYGPIAYIYNGEIYSQTYRSQGMSVAMGLGRATSAIVAISFLSLEKVLTQAGVFGAFCVISVLATAFVFGLVPETKGLTLEESGNLFAPRKRIVPPTDEPSF